MKIESKEQALAEARNLIAISGVDPDEYVRRASALAHWVIEHDASLWEIVVSTRREQVRRLVVPGGWIYQTQSGLRYSTAPGTIGRERDWGEPEWGPLLFVPRGDA